MFLLINVFFPCLGVRVFFLFFVLSFIVVIVNFPYVEEGDVCAHPRTMHTLKLLFITYKRLIDVVTVSWKSEHNVFACSKHP